MPKAKDTYKRARRANASGGLTQIAGDLGLVTAFCFWAWVFWGFIQPTNGTDPIGALFLGLLTLFLAGCMAIVQPALVAATLPNTAAAMYLQKLRRETWGFQSIVVSAMLLSGFSLYVLLFWWSGRLAVSTPEVTVSGAGPVLTGGFTAVTFIFFVIVPAWATNYGTPVLWLAEVQQTQQVKKLEIMHASDLMILKNRLLFAEQRAAVSYANLLPGEQEEVRLVLQGLFMGIADSQRAIARCAGVSADVERAMGILDDDDIIDAMTEVAELLQQPARQLEAGIARANDTNDPGRESEVQVMEPLPAAPVNQASGRLETRGEVAATRSATPQYAAEYETANRRLQPLFTVRQVAKLLGDMPERTARDVVDAWHAQGWVAPGNIRGQWRFLTEDEEA